MDNRIKQLIYDCMVSMEAINSLLVKKGIYTDTEREKEEEEVKRRKDWADTQDAINTSKATEEKMKNIASEDFMNTIFPWFSIDEKEW